jgi:acetyl esterase/lipase
MKPIFKRKYNFFVFGILGLALQSCTTTKKYVVFSSDNKGQKMYNVPYGLDNRQKMDVFLPQYINDSPFVILVHGGAWKYGDKSHLRQLQEMLYQHNISSAAINYRLVSKEITYHQQLDDITLAIDKLNFEANNWNIVPNRYILLGESAGAHLSLVYGYTHPEIIKKIISLSAPTDFYSEKFMNSAYSKYTLPLIEKMVGEKMDRKNPSLAFKNASPIALVSDVPTLIFQGGKDFLVSKEQGFALDSVLTEKKIKHQWVFMKNAGHVPRLTSTYKRDSIIYPHILDWIKND